jgi:hypothetical protein
MGFSGHLPNVPTSAVLNPSQLHQANSKRDFRLCKKVCVSPKTIRASRHSSENLHKKIYTLRLSLFFLAQFFLFSFSVLNFQEG